MTVQSPSQLTSVSADMYPELSAGLKELSAFIYQQGLPWWLSGSEFTCQCVGVTVLIAGLGRSPGEGNGNPFQYSCLGNPMDRGAWQATVHGVAKNQT